MQRHSIRKTFKVAPVSATLASRLAVVTVRGAKVLLRGGCVAIVVATTWAAHALAQASNLPASAEDSAPPDAGSPRPAPVAQAPRDCIPSCRAGFLCHQGQCISACNPPCGSGEQCTSDGGCAAIPIAQPPPPYDPRRDTPTTTVAAPPGDGTARRRFRAYVNFDAVPLGAGNSKTGATGPGARNDFGLRASWGLSGGMAFRLGSFFAIGGELRWLTWQATGDTTGRQRHANLDIGPRAIFRAEMGRVEVQFPVTLALSVQVEPGNDVDRSGLVLGVQPGVLFWVADHVGLQANVGYDLHLLITDEATTTTGFSSTSGSTQADVLHMLRLSAGASVGF